MLWGTPIATWNCLPLPGSYGSHREGAFDDDAPTDGWLDPERECYSYLFDGKPVEPLGKMVAYGTRSGGGCQADFNFDGFVTGDDFDGFVVIFLAGNFLADFNLDGFVTGDDFDAFVAAFVIGC